MTLLFFDGCQDPLLVPKPEYVPGNPWSTVQTGRDGGANGAAQLNNTNRVLALPSSAATCIAACAWFPNTSSALGAISGVVLGFCSAVATIQVVLVVNAAGLIEARRTAWNGTLLGTSSGHAPIAGTAWRHIAAKAVLHTSTGSVVVQLDGVTVLSLTGIATSSVISNVTHIYMAGASGSAASSFWDDIYVCDDVDATATQGRPNNDFLGDLSVRTLLPTGAGDTTQWTPSTGTNWSAVDETPPVTTDFVSDSTTGHRDLYALADITGVASAVYAVREGLYVSKSDAGPILVKPVVKENSTVTADPAQGVAVTAGAVYGVMKATKPSGGLWTQTDVNALQVGQEVG